MLFRPRVARADEIPAALQAELITRLAAYDKNMKARAGDRVNITVVVKAGDADSERSAAQLVSALGRIEKVGALPHDETTLAFSSATALAESCKAGRTAVVFVNPSLAAEVEAIRTALDGVDVLTVAPSADMTRRGVVLGFELVSSRPKLSINLAQAARQNVSMPAEILKLMTVFR